MKMDAIMRLADVSGRHGGLTSQNSGAAYQGVVIEMLSEKCCLRRTRPASGLGHASRFVWLGGGAGNISPSFCVRPPGTGEPPAAPGQDGEGEDEGAGR